MTAWTKEPWEWQQEPLQTLENRKRAISCVNGCAGLNPAAYRACVEALQKLLADTECYCQLDSSVGNTNTCPVHEAQAALAASQEGA